MIKIHKSSIHGEIKAPPSMAHAHRLVVCYALAGTCKEIPYVGTDNYHSDSTIKNILQDSHSGVDADCGKSFSSFRYLLPIACALGKHIRFFLHKSLLMNINQINQVQSFIDCLCENGAEIKKQKYGFETLGQIKPGKYVVPEGISAQYVSGLMFALPLLKGDSKIVASVDEREEYINCTISCLDLFGITVEKKDYGYFVPGNQKYTCPEVNVELEGDWLSAAVILSAAALTGEVTVSGLNKNTLQSDIVILDILKMFGAEILFKKDQVYVKKKNNRPIKFDAKYSPDLIPIVSILAACADGVSYIKNVDCKKVEYCDRIKAVIFMLREFGIKAVCKDNCIAIEGGKLRGQKISGFNDHRMIMAEVIAGLVAGGVEIDDTFIVSKSYPDFISDLEKLKAVTSNNSSAV